MFEVLCISPLDEEWESRDELIIASAGRKGDFSSAGLGERHHIWLVAVFSQAEEMKSRLNSIPKVKAYIRETSSEKMKFKK